MYNYANSIHLPKLNVYTKLLKVGTEKLEQIDFLTPVFKYTNIPALDI